MRNSDDQSCQKAPLGLGVLAEYTSCATALHSTAAIVLVANMIFAARATEEFSLDASYSAENDKDNDKDKDKKQE